MARRSLIGSSLSCGTSVRFMPRTTTKKLNPPRKNSGAGTDPTTDAIRTLWKDWKVKKGCWKCGACHVQLDFAHFEKTPKDEKKKSPARMMNYVQPGSERDDKLKGLRLELLKGGLLCKVHHNEQEAELKKSEETRKAWVKRYAARGAKHWDSYLAAVEKTMELFDS